MEPLRAIAGGGAGAVAGAGTSSTPPPLGASPVAPPSRSLLVGATMTLSAGFAVLLALAILLAASTPLDPLFVPIAIIVYGVIVAFALAGLAHHPFDRFGAPNVITSVRVVATSLFAGLILDANQLDGGAREPMAWLFAAIALFALALDGVDGYLARRLKLSSPYGARYDMEIDAFLILLLSVVAFALGKAGAFVLAIGLMRYAYVLAQFVWPWLAGELPPSFRRKAVCVMQVVVLGALVTPLVQPPLSSVAALVTIGFLAWSFALDIDWLRRRRMVPA